MVGKAESTAEILAGKGISAAVLNARFIKPLDEELIIQYADSTGSIFTMEDHVLTGGFGSAVMALLSSNGRENALTYRFGLPDCFVEHGDITQLQKKYGLDPESMATVIADRRKKVKKAKKARKAVKSDKSTALYLIRR